MRITFLRLTLAAMCISAAPALVFAQGSISGVVRDSSGAVLPGATVEASSSALIERVRRRGVVYERAIGDEYMVELAEAYARFFYQYDAAPVLIVNSDNLNFIDQPADFDLLLQRIAALRGPREFFSIGAAGR